MKFFLQFILSIFLAINVVAPSVISLLDFDENMEMVMEQNEDENQKENKEGEKENSDKDTFYHVCNDPLSSSSINNAGNITFYLEGYFNPTLNIFIPPPKIS